MSEFDAALDKHLDAILKASGSALRHYSMPSIIARMRAALRAALAEMQPRTAWKPFGSAPRDGSEFLALIGGLPYLCAYDEHARFIRYEHTDVAPGPAYTVHQIDGKELLEQTAEAGKEDYQRCGTLWKRGFNFKPTHWMPLDPPEAA